MFNYNKEDFDKKIDVKNSENLKGLDFKYVKDMILINNEIVIYLSISRIVEMELEEN